MSEILPLLVPSQEIVKNNLNLLLRYILLEVSINLFLKNGSTVKIIWKFQQCWQFVTKYKNMHNR